MADERDDGKIVTTFLLNTCRLCPRLTRTAAAALIHGNVRMNKHKRQDHKAYGDGESIPILTGSVAEFYIEPMLSLLGDVDVMYYSNAMIAIPRGHPPPTQLPAEFHNYVQVFEIVDSHLPGYVYLKLRYLMTQCSDDVKYNCVTYDERYYLPNKHHYKRDQGVIHGPALLIDNSDISQLSVDNVDCVRCLVWPSQAADWPARHRNYGWPDSATVDHAVSNGCDVVGVAHRQCRQHEWISNHQGRLSFSRAEIVLINSWMPVQQIVYHLLRYFMKTQQLTDCAENSGAGTMSNYHTKTRMLWACELKSRRWWTGDLNLVRICVELLNTLSVWLTYTRCPHYFVNNCNLLDNSFNVGSTASQLMSVEEDYLSAWLINNYIGQCAQLCPDNIARLFSEVSTSVELQNVVLEIVRWRLSNSLYDMCWDADYAEMLIPAWLSNCFLYIDVHSFAYWMSELAKIDKRLTVYLSAVALLHVARKMSRQGFNEDLVDIMSTVLGQDFSEFCSFLSLRRTELNTSELVELLQKSAVERLTAYRQSMVPEIAPIATTVTTDFEALYAYKRGDYQRCLQLSTQNVHTLLHADVMISVYLYPVFYQLLDDDLVSLTALPVIVDSECRKKPHESVAISQLTLSLYLMTQCQLKLHPSVTSLDQTLEYIIISQRRHSCDRTLDLLTLKLIEHKANWSAKIIS